jgi:sarcosine oxidase/L-pipecolate oxidase
MAAYDVVVVGAGIEGSATAYYLLKKGLNVLLLEQFSALHSRGSSHGQSRIIRRAYDKPQYVQIMNDAYTLWSDFEKESGSTLYRKTGILVFGSPRNISVSSTAHSLASGQVPHEQFSGREANRRYSQQLKLPEDYQCVFEEGGGILNAQKAVLAFQQQFQKLGGTLLDHTQVVEIQAGGAVVAVVTALRKSFRARHLVIAAGTWTAGLCSSIGLNLPFRVVRSELNFWKVEDPAVFTPDKFPVFIGYTSDDHETHFYGLPIHEYPGLLKVCVHGGIAIEGPDSRDRPGGPTTVAPVSQFISQTLRGVSTTASITEYCMYTMSPDVDPVIDRHPLYSNIIIASGFSGITYTVATYIPHDLLNA